ncbi:hypothetical protein EDB19DRAFT_1912888 [Suillus lakei]|nr:hypothetical protein EDB19DRAFT_1912888 [Suillus lakei]
MLGMSHMELLNYNEFYDKFMSMPASSSGAWVTGWVVNTYPMAWWTQAFDTANYNKFTGNLPNITEIREMVDSHFAQLPEGQLLVTLATYMDVRSTPVAQQPSTSDPISVTHLHFISVLLLLLYISI